MTLIHSKTRLKEFPNEIPDDFVNWGLLKVPERMKLRNRITPASLILSVPALSLSLSSISNNEPAHSASFISTHDSIESSQRHVKTTGSRIQRIKKVNLLAKSAISPPSIIHLGTLAKSVSTPIEKTDIHVTDAPIIDTNAPPNVSLVNESLSWDNAYGDQTCAKLIIIS